MTSATTTKRRRQNETNGNGRERLACLADQFEFKPPASARRTILPTLVICGGGVGAGIGRRIKWNLDRSGVQAHVRYIVLDTDETSQSSEGVFPGFSEREFCHLSIERVREVLSDPESHKRLAERLNLSDDQVRTRLLSIIDRGLDQAGQVRPIGVAAFWANHELVKRKLERQLADLRGLYSQLEQQLGMSEDVRLRPRLQVVVVGSLAGGTNSSFCVDLVAYVRQLMASHNIRVNGYYVLPNVLDGKLAGKPEEQARVRANACHTLRTIDAFDEGFGVAQDVHLGATEREMFPAPSMLHNNVYLMERFTADDRDLRNLEAVQDVVALHLAADIGTEIGDQLETADHNDVTRQNLAPDPATGRARRFSTLGASALGIPFQKLFNYCFARQIMDVCNDVAADGSHSQNAAAAVTQFLRENQFGDNGQPISQTYRAAAVPDIDVYVKPLYQRITPGGRQYHRNGAFPAVLQTARQQFRDKHQPKIVKHLAELTDATAASCEKALKVQVSELLRASGVSPARDFLVHLRGELDRIEQERTAGSDKSLARAVEADKRACAEAERLKGFFKKPFANRAVQDRAAAFHRQCLNAALDSEIAKAIAIVAQRLSARCGRLIERLSRSLEGLAQLRADADNQMIGNQPNGRNVTTASSCEVDISTREMFDNFYAENTCDTAGLVKSAATACEVSAAAARLALGLQGTVVDELLRTVSAHFSHRISKTTIADILEQELSAGGKARNAAMLKLREAVRATQPMWRAEPGRLGVTFGDTITMGVPGIATGETRSTLLEALNEASDALTTNPRYVADPSIVSTSDPHRIIVLRRSHGGRPHYLNCWSEMKRASDSWDREGGHSVDTFSSELMALMPSVEPMVAVSQSEEAFALALALAWIARRGPYYYWNLRAEGTNGAAIRSVRLASEWDGLAFTKTQLSLGNAVQTLVQTGRMTYLGRNDGESGLMLASGLDKARRAFLGEREKIEAVQTAFNDLRSAAGDQQVLRDLTNYIKSLSRRVKSTDVNYGLVMHQVEVLNQLIARLDNGE